MLVEVEGYYQIGAFGDDGFYGRLPKTADAWDILDLWREGAGIGDAHKRVAKAECENDLNEIWGGADDSLGCWGRFGLGINNGGGWCEQEDAKTGP